MDMGLQDQVAIVTGAGGVGIGNAIALALAKEGAHVVTNDIQQDLADQAAEQVKEHRVGSLATYADITNWAGPSMICSSAKRPLIRTSFYGP